jgi:hypothetical protein
MVSNALDRRNVSAVIANRLDLGPGAVHEVGGAFTIC